MARLLLILIITTVGLIQQGCGNGGSSAGVGNTVTLNSGSSTGSTLAISNILSPTTVDELSFDVTSSANFTDGSAQNVGNFTEVISFQYEGCSDPTYVVIPTLPSLTQNSSTTLKPGSTWTQKLEIGTPQIKQYVLQNYASAFQTSTPNTLRYKVIVTFTGTEATGKSISTTTTAGLWIISQ